MHSNRFRRTGVAVAIAGLFFALGAGQAFGAAFASQEQSVSGLGNAYAGGAAAAEDASTVWSNPAGMSRFSTAQIVVGVNIITPSAKFHDSGSLPALNQPLGGERRRSRRYAAPCPTSTSSCRSTRTWHSAWASARRSASITEWDDGWLGRYQALKSNVKTFNVNPAVSWRINDAFSLALGVDYQQIKATFTSNANYSAALAQGAAQAAAGGLIPPATVVPLIAATPGLDSGSQHQRQRLRVGLGLGAMWNISPDMRVGAHYRSSIKYNISGNVNFGNPALPPLGRARADRCGCLRPPSTPRRSTTAA